MTRLLLRAAALMILASCGEVEEREPCATSGDCPVGESCVHTSEGSVCWPDAVPPEVTDVTVACGAAGCLRDGELHVGAAVTDDREVLAVEATVGFDPAIAFPLVRGEGSSWTGTLPLTALDFPGFELEARVTVRALDGARNPATAVAGEGQRPRVGRVRWVAPLETGLVTPTPAAIDDAGTVVVGGSDGKLRFFLPDGSAARAALQVATGAIVHAPSLGAEAIWVGANDGKLHAVRLDGSGELSPSRTCTAAGVAKGPPAVLTTAGVDVAFGAFSNGRIVASAKAACAQTPLRDPFSAGPAIDLEWGVVATTVNAGASSARRFSWDGAAFEELWATPVGATVTVTPAFDTGGRIITGGEDGEIDLTTPAGATAPLATVGGSIDDSPIVLSNGDLVVGDAAGRLHRLSSAGTAVWDPPVDLGAPVHAPLALAGGPVRFLVATADGRVHALDDGGAVLWSGPLTDGMALGAGNLHTPAAPPGRPAFSTAYFGGADGRLYALVVEGRLDTSAPWPKAWHDARNSSRAGGPF